MLNPFSFAIIVKLSKSALFDFGNLLLWILATLRGLSFQAQCLAALPPFSLLESWRATVLATTTTAVRTLTAEQSLLRENKS